MDGTMGNGWGSQGARRRELVNQLLERKDGLLDALLQANHGKQVAGRKGRLAGQERPSLLRPRWS